MAELIVGFVQACVFMALLGLVLGGVKYIVIYAGLAWAAVIYTLHGGSGCDCGPCETWRVQDF